MKRDNEIENCDRILHVGDWVLLDVSRTGDPRRKGFATARVEDRIVRPDQAIFSVSEYRTKTGKKSSQTTVKREFLEAVLLTRGEADMLREQVNAATTDIERYRLISKFDRYHHDEQEEKGNE